MNMRSRLAMLGAAGLMVVAVIGFGVGPALAEATVPVTVPVMVGVNTTATAYYAPDANSIPVGQVLAGQTWYVLGTDSTAKWVEIYITPSACAWVPASAFALNGMTLPAIEGMTGGPMVANPAPVSVPAQHFTVALGSSAMVGVNTTTSVFYAPDKDVVGQLVAGQTWFVLGLDSTGKWAYVQITPDLFGWVSSAALNLQNLTLATIPGF